MSAPEGTRRTEGVSRPPVINTVQLIGAGREVVINHGEEEYRLRITQ